MEACKYFIHVSDLHYRLNWEENQEMILEAFLKDIELQIEKLGVENVYFVFSGDVVLAGGKEELYKSFLERFGQKLKRLEIVPEKRICIPGNHDVSVTYIQDHFVEHNGVITQNLNETEFNDYIAKGHGTIVEKFENYRRFEQQFCSYGLGINVGGGGWKLNESISVYCLNTALLSSGGFNQIEDKKKLTVDTRHLNKWLQENTGTTKIMVMHHPLDWLTEWASSELHTLLRNNFSLVLSGHVHRQDVFHSIQQNGSLIECSAPPLFTNKSGPLGYAIVSVCKSGVEKIIYRQWTGKGSFVRGVNFSNNDDGEIVIIDTDSKKITSHLSISAKSQETAFLLQKRLDNGLKTFSTQPILWINPVISRKNYTLNSSSNEDDTVDISQMIGGANSLVITAPPQFGLTCLAFFLSKEAWKSTDKIWVYVNYSELKLHNVEKSVLNEVKALGLVKEDIGCIILDSWASGEKDSFKILEKLKSSFRGLRLIIMQTMDESQFGQAFDNQIIEGFESLFLLPLPRNQIRKVINDYNQILPIGDEDTILNKITIDLDVLNIHRTPLNCLTLLKALENNFDDSPVNRSELIHSILFLLFQIDKIPTYKSKPDLKDCEFVLGRWCEEIIRKEIPSIFTRDAFIKKLNEYCKERVIELEVSLVFDILYNNNIIIKRDNGFGFRFSYWIYYFAAIRMRHSEHFANFIFEKMRYASYPELVEFYTGVDRSREDALKILIGDLKMINEAVDKKVGLPESMNVYRSMNWNPSEQAVAQINADLGEDVHNSKLPDSVKDQYHDKSYNSHKPYNQSIRAIFEEYSLALLWESSKAASRALRNSDYVDPEIKRELLKEITKSWKQISKVLFAISPILATRRAATFDGTGFVVVDDFGDDVHQRWISLLMNVSSNIVGWFKNDIASQKMGPLLFDHLNNETDELKRHQIALLIIIERPKNWKGPIQNYIEILHKNSFYLLDLYNTLQTQYEYGFLTSHDKKELRLLIKASLAKHNFGSTSKSNRIADDILGKREA